MKIFLNIEFKYKREAKWCGNEVKASKYEELCSKLKAKAISFCHNKRKKGL